MQQINLREYLGWGDNPAPVDAAAGIIKGVKILGLNSRNGRRYTEEALRQAAPLYEGAKVNVNHPQGDPLAPRDYRDRLGFLRQVRYVASEGLFADLCFNPKHDVAERLIWDAQHAPHNVGLSHNVLAKVTRQDDVTLVHEIVQVLSVDLVADPASTQGLFESDMGASHGRSADTASGPGDAATVGLEMAVRRLQRELALRRQLRQSMLTAPEEREPGRIALGPTLWRTLLSESDDARLQRLIDELGNLVSGALQEGRRQTTRPQSRDGLSANVILTPEEFARAIRKRPLET